MTQAASQFINALDALPPGERHEVATELLRRTLSDAPPEVDDDALVAVADDLFRRLDAEEADDGDT